MPRGGGTVKAKYRSAITGRYVTAAYAKKHPDTTVREVTGSDKLEKFIRGG